MAVGVAVAVAVVAVNVEDEVGQVDGAPSQSIIYLLLLIEYMVQ